MRMDTFADLKGYEKRLDQEWVQVLINLRMKYSKLFTRKRNSAAEAWKNILQEMIELGAPTYVTLNKIKKKWMNLIARYKQLKFSSNTGVITWPFFEQIDRAYSRNPQIVDVRRWNSAKGSESDESDSVSDYAKYMMQKQQFTSNLIQLRHTHRHLFTGKKLAAQKGWSTIQSLLPNGNRYTIEQISKCWQNLVHRYRNLLENEKDPDQITWVHFHKIHEIMLKKMEPIQPEEITIKTETPSPKLENDNKTIRGVFTKPKQVNNNCEAKKTITVEDVLDYLMERDKKLERFHQEISIALNNILELLQH